MLRQLPALGLIVSVACRATEVKVVPPPTATYITVSPSTATLLQGDTVRLAATVRDENLKVMPGATVKWSSSTPGEVSIDSTGLAQALVVASSSQPPVTVSATFEQLTATATVSFIWQGPLSVWPDTNALLVGMTRQLTARIINSASGYPGPDVVPATPKTWTSTDATVMTVDGTGLVTATGVGHAQIVAALGDGRTSTAEVFIRAQPGLRFVSVSGGQAQIRTRFQTPPFGPDFASQACGLTSGGDIYCWGVAQRWMTTTDRCETTFRAGPANYSLYRYRCSEIPQRLPSDVTFTSLAARGDFSCAIATSGRVYCWGRNDGGELGLQTTDSTEHLPAPIASSDAFQALDLQPNSDMVQSGAFSCALRVDGVAVCWSGAFGPPQPIAGITWRSLADAAGCGVAVDSTAYCIIGGAPQRIWGNARWSSFAGNSRYCALDLSGSTWCGSQTGSPVQNPTAPAILSLHTYSETVFSNLYGSPCGLTAGGDMYCFDTSTPRLVNPGGMKLKQFFAHCAIAIDDKAYCWSRSGKFSLVPGQ